ncbi:MAG: glycosyltransferase, partial [Cyanobacteria bacterium J06635_10]
KSLELIQKLDSAQTKIYTHPRYGLVQNWNYCIKKAKGKYIKFLFQDDLITSDCIQKMVDIAETNHQIGLVFCPRSLISEQPINSNDFPENLHKGWSNLKPYQLGIELLQDPHLLQHPHNKIGEPTAVLIRREVFDQIGLFDSFFKQYADLEMWLRIMTRYQLAFIDEKLASFRIHPNQATQQNLTQDISWSEIYSVWLKILYNPIYQVIPSETRQYIKETVIKQLIREYIKSIIFSKLYRWGKINELLIKAVQAKIKTAS